MHGRKEFPFVIIAGVGFPNGHSNPVRLAVVAIDPVDLNISEMSPDSIGLSVADQSFKFVGLGAFNRTPILSTDALIVIITLAVTSQAHPPENL